MGKNKQLKKLRRIAEKLPELERNGKAYHILKGVEVVEDLGISEIQDKPVELDGKYTIPVGQKVPINHARFIKKAFAKSGKQGVVAYVKGVNQYVQQLKEKHEQQEKKQSEEVQGVAEEVQDPGERGVADPDPEVRPLGDIQPIEGGHGVPGDEGDAQAV